MTTDSVFIYVVATLCIGIPFLRPPPIFYVATPYSEHEVIAEHITGGNFLFETIT